MAKILVVDDDSGCCEILAFYLESAGHAPTCVLSARDALEHLEHNTPDVVITDMVMPVMTGLDLIREIRELYPALPIISCSGGGVVDGKDYITSCHELGVFFHINKPLDPPSVYAEVEKALARE